MKSTRTVHSLKILNSHEVSLYTEWGGGDKFISTTSCSAAAEVFEIIGCYYECTELQFNGDFGRGGEISPPKKKKRKLLNSKLNESRAKVENRFLKSLNLHFNYGANLIFDQVYKINFAMKINFYWNFTFFFCKNFKKRGNPAANKSKRL